MKPFKHTIDKVVPWGRSFDEYRRMFALSEADLERSILSCADGPASFNAEMTEMGKRVVSFDPIYQYTAAEIRGRIDEARDLIVANTLDNLDAYVWDDIPDMDALVERRMSSMTMFLEDFEKGVGEGRYQALELPSLPFEDSVFDLALCSHFLFTYSVNLDFGFHLAAILEALRVAKEVRISSRICPL